MTQPLCYIIGFLLIGAGFGIFLTQQTYRDKKDKVTKLDVLVYVFSFLMVCSGFFMLLYVFNF